MAALDLLIHSAGPLAVSHVVARTAAKRHGIDWPLPTAVLLVAFVVTRMLFEDANALPAYGSVLLLGAGMHLAAWEYRPTLVDKRPTPPSRGGVLAVLLIAYVLSRMLARQKRNLPDFSTYEAGDLQILAWSAMGLCMLGWLRGKDIRAASVPVQRQEVDWPASCLYLRPFWAGRSWWRPVGELHRARVAWEGVLVEQAVARLGEVICIGNPEDQLPPVGATRSYIEGDWEDAVRDVLDQNPWVVAMEGYTPGLLFEWGLLARPKSQFRTALVTSSKEIRAIAGFSWTDFCSRLAPLGLSLPEDDPGTNVVLLFDGRGNAQRAGEHAAHTPELVAFSQSLMDTHKHATAEADRRSREEALVKARVEKLLRSHRKHW
jgi:hypothetical protein